ncbi:cytochrome P450 [Rhodotorula paludigena]|uniref:cytochrome P450 n=1 Tax=Rhodotorula paludigena TaxID=86838 RepID=UPI0031754B91
MNATLAAPKPAVEATSALFTLGSTTTTTLIAAVLGLAVLYLARGNKAKGPLPPGPPPLPIIGNLLDVPKSRPWVKFAEWTEQYGPIFTLKMGRNTMLVIGRAQPALDLLDKRSAIYSSRARLIMTSELVSRGLRMTFMPYGDLWRRERRLLHQLTSPAAASSYEPIQEMESAQFVRDMLAKPGDFWGHCQRYAGSTIMQIGFNKRAKTPQDPAITKMRAINEMMTKTAVAGRYLVDSLPILNYVPEFLAPFKQEASAIFKETLSLFRSHVLDVKKNVESGHDAHCFAKYILESQKSFGLTDDQAYFLGGALYGAGSDTTADGISTFIMTMCAFPDVQAKAQAELDRVVGRGRLPNFSDQPDLVYCGAVVREILRWRTVIAGGLAHASTEDDWYNGYFIPKGTIVLANHWAIHLDPEVYPEPEKFKPERFIDADGKLCGTKYAEAGHHAYGFGRRICPGKHIADRSLFIVFTRLLWSCTLRPGLDASTGTEIPINVDAFSEGFSSHPLPFKCRIEPRGDWVKEAVDEAVAEGEEMWAAKQA